MSAIQVKDVPGELHERARQRARARGLTLSQYLLALIREDLRRPTVDEWFERLERAEPASYGGPSGAELVREARKQADSKTDSMIEHSRTEGRR